MREEILVVVVAILAFAGCNIEKENGPDHRYFASADGLVEFQFPRGWHENEKDNPYDLQFHSRFERMTTAVFVYKKEDLATDSTPQGLLQSQIEDLRLKRENFVVLEQQMVVNHDEKTLTTVVYSGDKSASNYFYKFTLIEFSENPEILVVVLQVSIPSYWAKHKPILEEIVKSARIRLQETETGR